MNKILCIGDACADIIIPYGQAKLENKADVVFLSGGTVANTASGLGKLNTDVAFLGTAGTDYYGKNLKMDLLKDHVDVKHFKLDENIPTSQVIAIIDENNDRFNFLMPKENAAQNQIVDADLPESLLDEYDIIHTSGMVLFNNPAASSVTKFLKKAKTRNKTITLDVNLRIETVGLDTSYLLEAIDCTNYLFASMDDEIIPLTKIQDPKAAAMSLVNENRTIIARLGSKGSDIYHKDYYYHQDGFKVEVVDTLGAGDSFNAGFLYGLANNKDIKVCNQYGCATAAINITKKGARNCPRENELIEFLKER